MTDYDAMIEAGDAAARAAFDQAIGEAKQAGADGRQPAFDGLNKQVTDLTADVARSKSETQAVQAAFDAYKSTHTVQDPPPVITPEVKSSADFTSVFGGVANSGLSVGAKSLVGKGVDQTIYQMTPKTSTKGAAVAAIPFHSTNPYRLLRVGVNNASQAVSGLEVGAFTVRGTDQGHMYGGLMICYAPKSKSHDILVTGIPGNQPGPPGETFPYEIWHCDDHVATDIRVDGRDAAGNPVSATPIGLDNSSRVTMIRPVAQYAKYGFGIALWEMADVELIDGDFRFNRRAINQENAMGGSFHYVRPNCSGQIEKGPHIVHCSAVVSTPLLVEDPILAPGEWPLRIGVPQVGANYPAGGNKPHVQKVSDVKVIMGGVDVTNDKSKVVIGGGALVGW